MCCIPLPRARLCRRARLPPGVLQSSCVKRHLITVSARVPQHINCSPSPQRWTKGRSGLWAIFGHRFTIQREGQGSWEPCSPVSAQPGLFLTGG